METILLHEVVAVFPNPAASELNVALPGGQEFENVQIADVSGKIVLENNNRGAINVSSLSPGLYLLKLHSGSVLYTSKFMKE